MTRAATPELTRGEVYARLTVAGKDALDRMRLAGDNAEYARRAVETLTAEWHATIYDALESKVPASFIAEELNVSVSRIYKIRDEVAAYRQRTT